MFSVHGLRAEYPSSKGPIVRAAQDVSFDVPKGMFFTLLGPSGCGKTTTLRSIAGLERPTTGDISLNGNTVFSSERQIFVPPSKRNFGMVFQSYAIWPHMSVFDNAAFPLTVRKHKLSRTAFQDKVMRVLHAVALDHLAERNATKLSGGQQQRLALARALVMEPELLLLDEPLSNLDAKLRHRMRFELKRIQHELGVTTIYVTHDQVEALALSDNIAVMNEGRIVQLGTPRDIYERPASYFVADFIGSSNFLVGAVRGFAGNELWRVSTPLGDLRAVSNVALQTDARVTISVRPEDIVLGNPSMHSGPEANVCSGVVEQKIFQGDSVELQVRVGETILLMRLHPSLHAEVGEMIDLRIEPSKCVALPDGAQPAAMASAA